MINDVEDAVQETLFTASRRLVDLRRAEMFTAAWPFRIVKRECNRMRRSRRLLINQEMDETIQPVIPPRCWSCASRLVARWRCCHRTIGKSF